VTFEAAATTMFGVFTLPRWRENNVNFVHGLVKSFVALDEVTLMGVVTASYIAFYTAYDKQKKTLVLKNLQDLVTCGRGLDWTLVELNKAISLSAMTGMLMAFLPQFKKQSRGLAFYSMNLLWAHSLYSSYKFWGYRLDKFMSDKAIKQVSVAFGAAGHLALVAGFYGYISQTALAYSASILSVCHFWTMEVDYKYVLQVRPYAYLPFPLAAAVVASTLFTNMK
jgi:hypothetical protein